MEKSYYSFMAEINSDELYDRLVCYGLFSEKLPPIFTAEAFLKYCKSPHQNFEDRWYPFASYLSMRNVNIPRPIGIPTPMGHELLCKCIADNWPKMLEHFKTTTDTQRRKVSRIHLRKMANTQTLFKMNYKNWRTNSTPEPEILIGKRYVVRADISKCFPSIYTHALTWALAGKTEAKKNVKDDSKWYNILDHKVQYSKNGETHGLLIGPHTSNLLSELILCAVDKELVDSGWDYYRNIDDYTCYVKSKDDADRFLIQLNRELQKYDLSLNHKKTSIEELPIGMVELWVHQIQDKAACFGKYRPYVDYREVQSFWDFCISLTYANNNNNSILLYALKMLQKYQLTDNAKQFVVASAISLALIYPYIVPVLDEQIFEPYHTPSDQIKNYAQMIFETYFPKNIYEACSFAFYLALKYDFKFDNLVLDLDEVVKSEDAVFLLMAFLYLKKIQWRSGCTVLEKHAKQLVANGDMDSFWPFTFEVLKSGSLSGEWKSLKNNKISFLKREFIS